MENSIYRFGEADTQIMEQSGIPFGVFQIINDRIRTIVLSDGFCELFGFKDRETAARVMDTDMYRGVYPDDVSRVADAGFRFAFEGGEYNEVFRVRSPKYSEEYMVVHGFGKHIYTQNSVRLAVVWYCDEGPELIGDIEHDHALNNFCSLRMKEQSAAYEGYYDSLTGLPNMSHFFRLAASGRERIEMQGDKTAFLFFDLSGMKGFNRKYGFEEGDKLIRAVGRLLVKYFSNDCCSRFAQDHFAVYTHSRGLEERLRIIFEEGKQINGGKTLPIRAGIYIDEHEDIDISTACDRAKAASDKNRTAYLSLYEYFDETLMSIISGRSYILENLDRALEERWIEVYYQPIIRSASGKVCDTEALARWHDPEKGLLPPSEFISVLEDSRLIYKLDLYMIERVLEDMKVKESEGLYVVPVSVNLSRSDFDACDIAEEIMKRVEAAGISPGKLNIELTESVIGKDYDYMTGQVDRFHELGFNVWMDDFGSGYSALDVLQKFDFDLIKFDMKFVRQYDTSMKSRTILTELMQMIAKLGIDTVAEGVETMEHVRFLKEIGCDKVQGYFYSKPVPLGTILERYRNGEGIGFEEPLESDYYSAIGTTDLNDPGTIRRSDIENYEHYFGAVPMGIIEVNGNDAKVLRCNKAYGEFLLRCFGDTMPDKDVFGRILEAHPGKLFMEASRKAVKTGDWVSIEESFGGGITINSFIRVLAHNKFTDATAILVVVLTIMS